MHRKYNLFAVLASLVHCSIQPLYSTDFEHLAILAQREIQRNYTDLRSVGDPELFNDFKAQTKEYTKQLAVFAVKENEDFNELEESDKVQLAENLSEIAMRSIYHRIFFSLDDKDKEQVKTMLQSLRNISAEFNKLSTGDSNNTKREEALWDKIVEITDTVDSDFGRLNYIPVRELQFFQNSIKSIVFYAMNLRDGDIATIESLSLLVNLEEISLNSRNFTKIPDFTEFKSLKTVVMEEYSAKILNGDSNKNSICESIEEIDFGYSEVKSINTEFFKRFPNLKRLGLTGTKITDISVFSDDFFDGHPNIELIDLTECEIERFSEDISDANKTKFKGVYW